MPLAYAETNCRRELQGRYLDVRECQLRERRSGVLEKLPLNRVEAHAVSFTAAVWDSGNGSCRSGALKVEKMRCAAWGPMP